MAEWHCVKRVSSAVWGLETTTWCQLLLETDASKDGGRNEHITRPWPGASHGGEEPEQELNNRADGVSAVQGT